MGNIIFVNGNEDFTIMAVCLVAFLACVMALRNCDVPYALVAIWALGGVYRAQASKPASGYPKEAMSQPIANWATSMMVVVAIAAVIGLIKAIVESLHARKLATAERETEQNTKQHNMHYTDE